jgi:hypothetical protein
MIFALAQLLSYERFWNEAKFAYSDSTPQCLARLVALFRSTQGRGWEFFTQHARFHLRSGMRLCQLCRAQFRELNSRWQTRGFRHAEPACGV